MDRRSFGWAIVFLGLAAFAIPWFLWGSGHVVAGFPVWVWWHVGWLGLTALLFAVFARTDWDRWSGRPGGERQ